MRLSVDNINRTSLCDSRHSGADGRQKTTRKLKKHLKITIFDFKLKLYALSGARYILN